MASAAEAVAGKQAAVGAAAAERTVVVAGE